MKFHPDYSGDILVQSFSEILNRDLDNNGDETGIGDLTYGDVNQNVSQSVYYGINQREILEFDAKFDGVDIFAKTFNPTQSGIVSTTTGVFTLDHFFSTAEPLDYVAGSNLIGVAGTGMVYYTGVGATERLPDVVYAIRDNQAQFRVAISSANALSGTAVTFAAFGAGNKHVEKFLTSFGEKNQRVDIVPPSFLLRQMRKLWSENAQLARLTQQTGAKPQALLIS